MGGVELIIGESDMSNCNKEYQITHMHPPVFEEVQACKNLADIYAGRMFGYKKAKKQ